MGLFDEVDTFSIDGKEVKSIILDDYGVLYQKSSVTNNPILLSFTGETIIQNSKTESFIGNDVVIDYGDGNVVEYVDDFTHTYETEGTYTITIYGVTALRNDCFLNCEGLTSANIPNGVVSLGDYCFYNCPDLTSVTMGNTVTSMGDWCFASCNNLTSINISNNITSLSEYCFYECSSLTRIDIPENVTSLGDSCFSNCYSLNGINGTISRYIYLPQNIISLGEYCFRNCREIWLVSIPKIVTSIGTNCFEGCSNMRLYVLSWEDDEIIDFNMANLLMNENTLISIPDVQSSNYIDKHYPQDKLTSV